MAIFRESRTMFESAAGNFHQLLGFQILGIIHALFEKGEHPGKNDCHANDNTDIDGDNPRTKI
jgi:hypothetical protein